MSPPIATTHHSSPLDHGGGGGWGCVCVCVPVCPKPSLPSQSQLKMGSNSQSLSLKIQNVIPEESKCYTKLKCLLEYQNWLLYDINSSTQTHYSSFQMLQIHNVSPVSPCTQLSPIQTLTEPESFQLSTLCHLWQLQSVQPHFQNLLGLGFTSDNHRRQEALALECFSINSQGTCESLSPRKFWFSSMDLADAL